MVLIHSISFDVSTIDVIDWLSYENFLFVRVNSDLNYKIEIDKEIFIQGKSITEFKSYWYRKGVFLGLICPNSNNLQVQFLLEENRLKILQYVESRLCNKKYINRYYNASPNKLIVLEKAKTLEIQVPNFVLTDNLEETHSSFIYKPINDGGYIDLEDCKGNSYTELFRLSSEQYGVTFFQELIEKKYELRIFYLCGKFSSMAIFSQNDNQTKVDFRRYNKEKPNRNIPFKLPTEIENKLDLLMKELDLKSGSIDMVVSRDREYYFLEVNPVGQFGMVSFPCNYHLEREIAEYLHYD